ncbi:unnamed protein product [Notodromas monacha]|uniref:Histidine ammonia-lyase n=1 Tax=Notodromas monacha TaxID=399045 RepID=A0A7R9BJ64_9CRUS|nr:unnamed protein product [Notodromas monacha]CAG0915710.1 unnamed protein product [Notodromas monacha]
MKFSVRVRGEWLQIADKSGTATVRWLGEEALRKYEKLEPATYPKDPSENGPKANKYSRAISEIRKTKGGAILDPEDTLADVLDDNDFVSVGEYRPMLRFVTTLEVLIACLIPTPRNQVLESDKPNPQTDVAEIKYIPEQFITLDGNSLTPDDLVMLGKYAYKIRISSEAEAKVREARTLVDTILEKNSVVYGITTGFGNFARTVIGRDDLKQLQKNLIRSHAAGVGPPLSPHKTRMLLALRINVLAKGHSGISFETLQRLVAAFNASCLSWVPEQGSVGASGDLAPLAHLALGLLGEGKMWSPETGWGEAQYVKTNINGTQLITALGAEAVERAEWVSRQADVIAAFTLDVLKGSSRAFDSDVQRLRPHVGQRKSARRLRALLHSYTYPSLYQSHRFCNRVQDAYTLRCCPQVHGIAQDTIEFVRNIITTEMNSATDNPRKEIISAGNFHGEYPAKALDFLAIAVHELGSMSERRIERLVNPALSELPGFLTKNGGLNSGFMIAHCTAASLVSENKVLCHPASVDSLSTSAAQEDHVSMGAFAARKALQVVQNVEHVVGIELLAACQAMEFLRPLRTTVPLEEVYRLVRRRIR